MLTPDSAARSRGRLCKRCAALAQPQTSLDSLSGRVDEAPVPAALYLDARELKSACKVQHNLRGHPASPDDATN